MKNIKNIKFVTAFTKQFITTKKRGKWLGTVALAFFMVFLLSTCSQGATNKFKTEGEPTGLELDFLAYNVPNLSFDKGSYEDISDVKFPVDEHGLLSSTQNGFGYYAPKNPALFVPHVTPNAGQSQVQTYNIGGFEYSAWLRLTDNSKVIADAQGTTNAISKNEPQGAIMAVPFINANKEPLGSLFVAVFQDKPFPENVQNTPLGIPINLCDNGSTSDANAGKGLCKNVALMMNFHEDPRTRAYVIATARVPEIGTTANSMAFDPQAGPNPQDREQVLKANGFHKISLQVGDDVPDQDLGDGSFHGPTLRVLVNDKEVIVYKNRGGTTASHVLEKGWWDSVRDAGLGGKRNLSANVFKTVPEKNFENGNPAPYVGFFTGTSRTAPYSNGAKEYNQAWKNLVGHNGNMANMATFGLAFQLGATGKSGEATTNSTLSPQLAQIKISSYHEGDNSGVTVAIDQIPDTPTDPIEIEGRNSVNLTATVTSTSSSDFSKAIRWESNDTNIAWVDTKGVVRGKTAGPTKVKAIHVQTGATSEINIVVKPVPVTGITLSQSSLNLAVNESQTVTVANVAPANANNKNVTWSTDNASVASVNATGKITGVADGTATITATAQDGSGITATVAVTVTTVTASSISLSPSSIHVVAYYKTTKLTPQFSPANTTNKAIASWVSGDSNIATVDGSGNVKGIATGSTTITATSVDGSHTATATVNVTVKDLNSVFFNDGSTINLPGGTAGHTKTYTFAFSPVDASVKTLTCTRTSGTRFNVSLDGNGCKFGTTCSGLFGNPTVGRVTATDVNGNVRTAEISVKCP